jgi:carbon starvation protein CstA
MISFIIGIIALVVGYIVYGKLAEKVFVIKPDNPTPATRLHDGVDYVAMDWKKALLIQLLNIAGTGPIFGAIAGALFGPAPLRGSSLAASLPGRCMTIWSGCSP